MLTGLLSVPVLGILVLFLLPRDSIRAIRWVALATTAVVFVLSLQILQQFVPGAGIQFQQRVEWIPQMHIFYQVGLDGISLPMVLLTTLLSLLACLASWSIAERHKEYFILYLLLELGLLGTFLALDLFLFYIFWEVVLVPMYFLIGIWGGGRREYSAFKFFIYTLAGSLAMLLSILTLYLHTGSFDMIELSQMGWNLAPSLQNWIFMGFFLAFAIKIPIFPFHTWLPDAHVDAPTPISVILAGVLLKMGAYGFFRVAYPILPDAAIWISLALAILGMINIVYGAFVAMAQTDFKRLVAYSSVSHMGFVLLGLASLTPEGMQGAMLQMFNHGIIVGGMFLLVGVLYDRTHTRDLSAFGGLGARVPVYARLLAFFSFASLGLPGLSGFVGEFLSLIGAFGVWRWQTIVSVFGIVVAAAYMLKVIRQVLLGPLNPKWEKLTDINLREVCTLAPLVLLVVAIGVYPLLLMRIQDSALQSLIQHVLQP